MIRRLLCQVLGHRWYSPIPRATYFDRKCRRCQAVVLDLPPEFPKLAELRFPYPPGSLPTDPKGRPAEAWRLGWDQASDDLISPSPKVRDTESGSAPRGAGR